MSKPQKESSMGTGYQAEQEEDRKEEEKTILVTVFSENNVTLTV